MSETKLLKKDYIDQLCIRVYDTDVEMGKAAAKFVAGRLLTEIGKKGYANLILATGASQFEFLKAFKELPQVDWSKVNTFHLDEYVGLPKNHPASFRKYLHDRIIDEMHPGNAYFIQGDADDLQAEVERYELLLKEHPADVACIGIGENGHIAFNDPPVADFKDSKLVKIVELDPMSRKQQVGEGWFDSLEEVPRQAVTLTIPAIMRSATISCVVPEQRKADAVYRTLNGPVSTRCPASILRRHPDSTLFLDRYSASLYYDHGD